MFGYSDGVDISWLHSNQDNSNQFYSLETLQLKKGAPLPFFYTLWLYSQCTGLRRYECVTIDFDITRLYISRIWTVYHNLRRYKCVTIDYDITRLYIRSERCTTTYGAMNVLQWILILHDCILVGSERSTTTPNWWNKWHFGKYSLSHMTCVSGSWVLADERNCISCTVIGVIVIGSMLFRHIWRYGESWN